LDQRCYRLFFKFYWKDIFTSDMYFKDIFLRTKIRGHFLKDILGCYQIGDYPDRDINHSVFFVRVTSLNTPWIFNTIYSRGKKTTLVYQISFTRLLYWSRTSNEMKWDRRNLSHGMMGFNLCYLMDFVDKISSFEYIPRHVSCDNKIPSNVKIFLIFIRN
jgi:hypothetical protein